MEIDIVKILNEQERARTLYDILWNVLDEHPQGLKTLLCEFTNNGYDKNEIARKILARVLNDFYNGGKMDKGAFLHHG